jgi:uncharacterized protein (TIGR02118 family)
MLKIVVLVEKREDLTWEEFVDYWDEEHVDHVAKIETLRRYTIAPALKPDEAPYDGIAELYFESTDDVRDGFTDELERELQEDEAEFLAGTETFVTTERTQIDRI